MAATAGCEAAVGAAGKVRSPDNPVRPLGVTPAANTDPNAFRLITIALWSSRYWCVVVPFGSLDRSFREVLSVLRCCVAGRVATRSCRSVAYGGLDLVADLFVDVLPVLERAVQQLF
jgi:hypothetical protein